MAGWRWVAAGLVSMALAFLAALTLAGGALADGDEQEAAAPAALQQTQVVAEIPDGYNQLFPLQWGGGSLYQLKARLGTMGCLANTIWNYDGGEWHGYNQYHVPSTLNAEWLSAYEEFVPAGSLYATCFDGCTFSYFDAPRPADVLCLSPAAWFELEGMRSSGYLHPIDESSTCTDDFDPRVKQGALPSMPLYPNTCIVRQEGPMGVQGNATNPFINWSGPFYLGYPSLIVVFQPPDDEQTAIDRKLLLHIDRKLLLHVELHELCHVNQSFHIAEQMQPDRLLSDGFWAAWILTEPGRTFVDLVGFARDADGDWSLPDDTYRSVYGNDDPLELAAELCTVYFLRRMIDQEVVHGGASSPYYNPVLPTLLTSEIVEWIETWVALPEIVAPETG